MLKIKNLSFSYDTKTILDGIHLEIQEGKITSLLGANGCGKTTLLNLISKNLHKYTGEIQLQNQNIQEIGLRHFAKSIAVVHQKNTAPDDLTVERLVSYGRLPYSSILKTSLDEENQKYVENALELTNLVEFRDRPLGTLSGGQRQRAFIAMALAQNAKMLLLDEPTTFLDVRYQVEIMRLITKLNQEHGITILMVLHDINQALAYSHEVIGLAGGGILFQGQPEDVISSENIQKLYGIDLPVFTHKEKLCVLAV